MMVALSPTHISLPQSALSCKEYKRNMRYTMDEKFRYKGHWWLPGAGENGVPGIVEFEPDRGTTLDLMGSLKGLEGIVDPIEPEVILGLSSDGKLLTLKDCAKTLGNLRFGEHFEAFWQGFSEIFLRKPQDIASFRGAYLAGATWRSGLCSLATPRRSAGVRFSGRAGVQWRAQGCARHHSATLLELARDGGG